MNDTIKGLMDRKSVRAYEDKEISPEDKEMILLSAVNAPSAGNQQMYKIIDVQDQKLKDELSVLCDHQPFIAKGKMVLLFCADFRKWYDAFDGVGLSPRGVGKGDLILAAEDAAIAAQNAVTAAWSLGIGSCYIGDILENKETIKDLLELPDWVFPAIMLVFGYPTEQQCNRPKPKREALWHLVCENKYHRSSPEELRKMFMEKQDLKSEEEYTEWLKRFHARKYDSDFSREMTRSVNEYLKEYE